MNKYFDKNDMFNSNSRIYEAHFTDSKKDPGALQGALNILLLILQLLSKDTFLRKIKASLVAFSLIGLIGIAGAVEIGSLGMGAGLLIGAVLVAIEYLCLRCRHRA